MKISLPEESAPLKETKRSELNVNAKITENGNMTAPLDETNFPHYKRVSDYLLGTCIGEGSFAKVRVGLHSPTKEKVAVKIINKAKARRDSYVFKNLHREGRLLQMLRHPNIVQVFDILETGNNYYLVTELCNGGELIDIVTDEGSLPEETVCHYTKQLTDAVAYMHDRQIVHRDLKVENLLLDSEGNVKIIDFGLSNILPEGNSDPSSALITQCGSPAYAAPELLAKRSYGPKVDVWSIGVITYALLVGKLPFTVEPFNIPKLCKKMMRGEMNHIPPFVSSACRTFIRKSLAPDQNQRPSIREVGKLKWLSMFSMMSGHGFVRNSMPGLYIDTLGRDGNLRRRHSLLTPLLHPPIDSSVVREMNSSFGFTSSEVIQSVQKNRPGQALATYHLLNKRKSRRKTRMSSAKPFESTTFVKSVQTSKQTTIPEASNDPSSASDSSDSSTKPQTPMQPQSDKLFDSDETTPEKMQTKENRKTRIAVPPPTPEVAKESKLKPSIPVKPKLTNIPVETGVIRNNYLLKEDSGVMKGKRLSIASEKKSPNYHRLDSKPLTTIRSKSPASDVSEMLASMRKARQVLAKKQQLNQKQKQLNLTNSDIPNPSDTTRQHEDQTLESKTMLEEQKSLPTTFMTQSKSAHKVIHRLLLDQRSASQQGPRAKTETNQLEKSPFKRPASHNSVLQDNSDGQTVQSRLVNTLSSPRKWRFSTESSQASEKSKKETSPTHQTNRTNSVTLPKLVQRQSHQLDQSPYAKHPTSPTSRARSIRQSLPASHGHFTGNQRFPLHSTTDSNTEPIRRRDHKSLGGKTSTVPRWQKSPRKDASSNFTPHYNYFAPDRPGNPSPTRQRPKKVISEPIAATISYLTSIKQKTFNKEKPPTITG